MFKKTILSTFAALLALSLVTLSMIGCGGSSHSSILSQDQALMAASDLFYAMTSAPLGHSTVVPLAMRKTEANGIRYSNVNSNLFANPLVLHPQAGVATPQGSTTIPTYTFTCPLGGNIVVNGTYSGTTTSSTLSIVETINNCKDTGFTMNGSPSVAITDTYNDSGTVTTDTASILGGFTVGSSTCSINLNVTASFSDTTYVGSEVVTGSICGIDITGSYGY